MENWPLLFLATMTYHVGADVLVEVINPSHTFIIKESTLRLVNLNPAILSFDITSFPQGYFSSKYKRYCYHFAVLPSNKR